MIDCYSCNGEKIIGDETCLCGKKNINEIFLLENKETHKKFNIGSTCVSNWIYKKKINTKIEHVHFVIEIINLMRIVKIVKKKPKSRPFSRHGRNT